MSKINRSRPLLVMFVGVPGSGKTTFARQLTEELGAVLLNSDALRISMWRTLDMIKASHADPEMRRLNNQLTFGAMNYAAKQALRAGVSVVYDCNANHRSERDEKHDISGQTGALTVVVRLRVPFELSVHRIQHRDMTDDQRQFDSKQKATEVVQQFVHEIEEPTADENVIEINRDIPFVEQYKHFTSAVEEYRSQLTD